MGGPSRGERGRGRGGGGRGSGRGYGRGSGHRGAAGGPSASHPTHVDAADPQNTERRAGLELEVESVTIPNAFEASCAHVRRCRERGRLFHLPLPAGAPTCVFAVVERTIGGIDDVVYGKHREVWERLPRGNARVYVKGATPAGERYTLFGAVNGLRKFGYSDSSYGYPDAVQTVIAIEKENGECGHLSAFTLPAAEAAGDHVAGRSGQPSSRGSSHDDAAHRFWVVGSKNVHIVLDFSVSEDCLRYYDGLGRRYSYAVKIARLWKAMLPTAPATGSAEAASTSVPASGSVAAARVLTAEQARTLHDTLHANQWTSCFEAIFSDSQHLVDYDGANELRFYAVTQNKRAFDACGRRAATAAQEKASPAPNADAAAVADGSEAADGQAPSLAFSREDGLCLPVAAADALYTSVGLAFSHHSAPVVYKSEAYAALLDDIGRRANSEGCVMYGADASGAVVRLWKEKSYPYVMERATREAITNHKLAGKDLEVRLTKKLQQQQPELRRYFKDWEANRMPWLLHFAAWLQVTRRLTPHMQRDELFPLRNRWLSLQKEFQAGLDRDPELYDVCGRYQPDPVQWGSDAKDLDVIKFVGPQGCGKSTLSRAFYALLQQKAQYRPRWVNQDEAGNRNKFLASLRQATHAEAQVTHLLIDKMNLDAKMNHDYDNLPLSLTVTWYHPDGENAFYGVCIDRVLGRGSGHRTIRLDPSLTPQERQAQEQNIRSFVRKAVRACEAPQDPAEVVLELDISTPLPEMVRMMWSKLQENGTHPLPAITDDDVSGAIELAHRYESLLCDLPQAPIYACIGLRDDKEIAKLLAVVPPAFTAAQVVQREFHLTTKYFGGETDPVAFVALAERLGQTVQLTLESVVADGDGVAVTVRRDDASYPCANAVPHITISNRKGVPPKYSNELISPTAYPGDPSGRTVVALPPDVCVSGVFEFR